MRDFKERKLELTRKINKLRKKLELVEDREILQDKIDVLDTKLFRMKKKEKSKKTKNKKIVSKVTSKLEEVKISNTELFNGDIKVSMVGLLKAESDEVSNIPNKLSPAKIRENNYKSRYGISTIEYYDILEEQDMKCKICGKEHTDTDRLVVDHKHVERKVRKDDIRGLLCHNCNKLLGFSGDNKDVLSKAITYLIDNAGK